MVDFFLQCDSTAQAISLLADQFAVPFSNTELKQIAPESINDEKTHARYKDGEITFVKLKLPNGKFRYFAVNAESDESWLFDADTAIKAFEELQTVVDFPEDEMFDEDNY